MDYDENNPIQERMEDIINQEFARQEREAAKDLLQYGYHLLPFELIDLYDEISELHRSGRIEESSEMFDEWMDQARDMGLI